MPNLFSWAGLIIPALFLLAGCDGSTAPRTIAANLLARHIDSLVVAARGNPRDSLFAAYLGAAETVPAYGGNPTPITVTTGSGTTETWQGLMLAETTQPPDTAYFFWAYSDAAFTRLLTVLWVNMSHAYSATSATLITNDTLIVTDITAQMVASIASAGDACSLTSGLQVIQQPPATGSCSLATFTMALTMSPEALGKFQIHSIAVQSYNGVLLK